MKVLVYGATGTQAGPLIEHLQALGHTPHAVTRNSDSAADVEARGAVPLVADLADAERLDAITREVDAVAFLMPTFLDNPDDAAEFARHAIDAAVQADVGMFVWNASGAINESESKQAILEHLQRSDLPYAVFEPTTYMENWLGPWTAPSVREHDELTYPVLADRKIGWIASADACKLVAAALERPELSGKRYAISGVESPTGPELAVLFSSVLGQRISYRAMTPDEMGAVIDAAFGPGSGTNVAEMYRREQEDPNPPPKYHNMAAVLADLPVRMSTIEEWVSLNKNAFV